METDINIPFEASIVRIFAAVDLGGRDAPAVK
jgi:hypothetical protein